MRTYFTQFKSRLGFIGASARELANGDGVRRRIDPGNSQISTRPASATYFPDLSTQPINQPKRTPHLLKRRIAEG